MRMSEVIVGGKGHQPEAIIYQKKIAAKPFYKGTQMVDVSISYPQVDVKNNLKSSQDISAFYRNSAREYYNYAANDIYNSATKEYLHDLQQHFPFREYQVMQTYEATYNLGSLLSIYYDRYEYTAGAHGNTTRAADTWYLPNAMQLSLSDFFVGSYYKAVFFEFVTNEVKSQIEQGNTYYFDDYAKNVFRYFDEKNYYLTDSGFAVFYPLYTIAAYVQGIPVFIVPYEAFGRGLRTRLFQ